MEFWRRAAEKSKLEHIENKDIIRKQVKVNGFIVKNVEKQQLI